MKIPFWILVLLLAGCSSTPGSNIFGHESQRRKEAISEMVDQCVKESGWPRVACENQVRTAVYRK